VLTVVGNEMRQEFVPHRKVSHQLAQVISNPCPRTKLYIYGLSSSTYVL
jgi:hypothetical protein